MNDENVEATLRSLGDAFAHACALASAHIKDAARLDYGNGRTQLLERARIALRDARDATRKQETFLSSVGLSSIERSALASFEAALRHLEDDVEKLTARSA